MHGIQSVRDVLQNDLKLLNDGKLIHSWLATAKQKKKCNIQGFVWKNLLGECKEGLTHPCNKETNLYGLDITSLINIFNNVEHIVPCHILSQADINNLKMKYKDPIEAIKSTRNDLAHYPFVKGMPKPEFDDR